MPSNQTSNYQLSQWERSDKVQMEDFNADNAKIDEALFRADRRGLQVIKEIVTTESSNQMNVEFPEIDWKEWNTVRVIMYPGPDSTNDIDCYIVLDDPVGRVALHGTQIIFFSSGRDDFAIMGVFLGSRSAAFAQIATRFKSFHFFFFRTESYTGKIGRGTKLVFLGEHV